MGGTPTKLVNPAVFLKPNSSVIPINGVIIKPKMVKELHHEVELGVIISKQAKRIKASDWKSYVQGYCVGLDMTARDLQAQAKKDGMPWTLGKCWDTFTGLSTMIPVNQIPDPHNIELWLKVDNQLRQKGSTNEMMAQIPELLEYISSVMTLEKGDVILTGTPEGVGPVEPGNIITAGITGLMEMRVPVVAET